MLSSTKSKCALVCVAITLMLGGCVDPMSNKDRISSRSGNASEANTGIQSIRTWPPNVYDTRIRRGG